MYGFFEGGFRRLPEQNLAGASKHSRKGDFLLQIQWERANRQLEVKRKWCATEIQAVVRGFLVRRKLKKLREEELNKALNSTTSFTTLSHLGILISHYNTLDRHNSPEILNWLISQTVNHRKAVIDKLVHYNSSWLWKIKWLLKCNLKYIYFCLDNASPRKSCNIRLNLHFLDTMTNLKLYAVTLGESRSMTLLQDLNLYMVKHDFIAVLKGLLYHGNVTNLGLVEKNPMKNYIDEHLNRLIMFTRVSCNDYTEVFVREFSNHFLTNETTESCKEVILQAMLSFNLDCIKCFVAGTVNGTITPSTAGFFCMTELFKTGRLLIRGGLIFGKVIEAFAVLLNDSATYCPKVKYTTYFEDEPMATDNNDMEDDEEDDDAPDDDPEEENKFTYEHKKAPLGPLNKDLLKDALKYVKSIDFAVSVLNNMGTGYNVDALLYLSKLVHVIVTKHVYLQFKILWYAPLHPSICRDLWIFLYSMQRRETSKNSSLLSIATKGQLLTAAEARAFYPTLMAFSLIFKRHISIYNYDPYNMCSDDSPSPYPFPLARMVELCVRLRDLAISLIKIGMPDKPFVCATDVEENNMILMRDSYKVLVNLVRLLHAKEFGRDQEYWIFKKPFPPPALPMFSDCTFLNRHQPFSDTALVDRSVTCVNSLGRLYVTMRDLPCTIPIESRLAVLQNLFGVMKNNYQSPQDFVSDNTFIKIRRDYIYEDAFEKLSDFEMPDIRLHIRIQLVSAIGYDEVGVDGGGIFREFIHEFLKSAFDPNRGFFLLNHDRMLYPNPNVEALYNNFRKHYYFIGRMLAKALYEGILLDLPLASCFLSAIIKRDKDATLSDLQSLDPVLYNSLISLLSFDGDVTTLQLNYTSAADHYGQTVITELTPGGEKISVDSRNKIDYVQTVAHYKLNLQFEPQCHYFRQGIASVFSIFWLGMFSVKELQRSVFCSNTPINVPDLKGHCAYTGGYTCSHPNIIRFWKVFENFTDAERKLLLKFVTSCSRQPMLGFKDLDPPFTIQLVENSDRLPTASTCMNLLKLPLFPDEQRMRERLLLSIQSQAGFDLC